MSINVGGPTKILNEVKINYFQEKYKTELYKVYVTKKTGKIDYEVSDDIARIKNIVEDHINKGVKATSKTLLLKTDKNIEKEGADLKSGSISLTEVSSYFSNNKYIQISSKLLTNHGYALAIWENNNSILEESVLIILEHRMYSFVIWENIHENRACYIFKYQSGNFQNGLSRLKKFISSNLQYKRENLFRNKNFRNYKLMFEDYATITHENPASYEKAINNYLSPFFIIK